jgi:tetratricopeptide (TPR) repeat protein
MKILFFTIILFISTIYFNKLDRPTISISNQQRAKNYNPEFLRIISLGNNRLLADFFWIQSLIESDLDHYKSKDLNNWLYLRFNTILLLDPKFLEAYQYGGLYLSILKDDKIGAKDIYERGLRAYPNDYFLIFNAGFHYFFELNDEQNALKLLEKIQYSPRAPANLPSIVAKLKARAGDLEEAYELMLFAYNRTSDESSFIKKSFKDNLDSIRIELDLRCLNSQKSCITSAPEGYRYILQNGKYTTDKPFKKFDLAKKFQKK